MNEKTITATVHLREDETGPVAFTIWTEAGEIASGTNLSIADACQEIGAAFYEAE